jgi:molybdate transport system substrate-binding protein
VKSWNRVTLAAVGLTLGAAAPGASPRPETLIVYAAASLTAAFSELGRSFEQQHRGVAVQFNFAGSQQLASQLEQGARADVFASADQRWMDYARMKGLVEDGTPVFARNRLVVIVPPANPARIERLEDLSRSGIKLVLAGQAVPAGKYSRRALENLAAAPGFPPGYDRRVLANLVSQEETVKGVVAKVQLGEADAGMVYQSDVTPAVARKVRVFHIPDRYNVIASYPVAVLKSSGNPEMARKFVQLLSSDAGQGVLKRHGFLRAPAPAASTSP